MSNASKTIITGRYMSDPAFKEFLVGLLSKLRKIVEIGESVMKQIPSLANKVQKNKHDDAWLEFNTVDQRIQKRRYGTTQAAELAGISHSLLYTAEEDGRLPKPEYRSDTARKVRAGYTMNHINHIREVFGTAPRKPEGVKAAVVGFLNLKGGSQKTTNTQLFAQNLAIRGYRVLVLDTDPQGSLSLFFGKIPDDTVQYEHTMAPYMLDDEDWMKELGHKEGVTQSLDYAVQKTYWSNIDIIPSCLQNLNIDLNLPMAQHINKVPTMERLMKLRYGLMGLADNYDFILIDGTPSLNISTLNVLSACDVCFVPTPAAMMDYASTLKFTNLIADTIENYAEQDVYPNMPDVRYFITKYTRSSYAQFMGQLIRKVFTVERGDVLSNEAHASDEIGKANNSIYTIYETNPSESDNRKRLKITTENFDALYNEMHDAVCEVCFDGEERTSYSGKIDQILENAEREKTQAEGVNA
jgi:chromosome partitioning protein